MISIGYIISIVHAVGDLLQNSNIFVHDQRGVRRSKMNFPVISIY